ncbi:amidohydrolase [Paracoccus alkanivorans]|uniref:Amidohydrolase n=1 Tax=Paracoccus alkanivorans TaxID=2116655 RepID=A0A3M0ML13_9RHOB|nr:amidohydrolase [Paracoccus alkanivorans]RMC36350.1 amidohydrolase [Paracoccus alkanivorans]
MSGQADLVLTNGRIWKGLGLGFTEALACAGGKVLATGSSRDIDALAGPETHIIDLGGRLATPGLNDAHMHLHMYGLGMAEVDLRPKSAPDLAALLGALKARATETPKGEWITGRGYDHFKLDTGRHPYREELDEACPDHPVYIVRTCGHLAVANSAALRLAGITEDTPSPEGGLIERQNGRLTGLLAETGREPVTAVLPRLTVETLVDAIERGGRDLLSYGITSCMEAAIGIREGWPEMEAYLAAKEQGRLPLRVYGCIMGDKTRSILEQATEAGMITGAGDEMFRHGPVKIFTDGSAGGRTAAMTRPYIGGDPDDRGLLCIPDQAELTGMVMAAHRAGYQMAIHAIGDAAIDQVLEAYEAALADMPAPDRRHRIEHCGWLRPDQMQRMKEMHVIPVPQPSFLYWFGDLYCTVAEQDRVEASHPMRTWIEAGLHPSASTDCPVTEIDPMPVIYNMVTRKTSKGTVLGPEHRLSMEEALHAYTAASAYASHEEKIKGLLEPGMLGDIAVWERDLFTIDPEQITATRCDATILGGRVVHEREGQ